MTVTETCSHCGRGDDPGQALTTREREVLGLLASGHTMEAIAARLFVSPNTVKNHLAHVYRKLGVRGGGSARKAVAVGRRLGVIT